MTPLTADEVKHITLFVRPMQPQHFDMVCECRIRLDAIEDIQSSVEVFSDIILVFPEVKIEGAKDDANSDVSMKCRYEQPCSKVVAGNESCNTLPYLRRSTVGCRFVYKVNLCMVTIRDRIIEV